ncbi:hypothetical protein Mal4_16790 [Maioricimonas rarisocia]|uniref:BP74 N-terminal domain-containing protein n=1 Tax=Maioricimonas rarisocia TaxID=2528026 RepID=A0A517Z4G0_9PLAN|nr:calmodulin [Maioricimonas rarisocia]QDU37368.1 hypothetical protein Mal4_16790 [Maioricimonas rarisocia]
MHRPNAPAFFAMTDTDGQPRFIIRIDRVETIEHARNILAGTEKQRIHVRGTIVKRPADYNPGWRYHLHPDSIEFFELSMEVCDAAIQYVEDHLEEVGGSTLPGCYWCPWSSRLVAEVTDEIET